MMDKGLIAFSLVFVLLIGAGIYQGSADQITPNVAQAQADLSIGAAPVQVIEKVGTWVLKLIGGAAFTGILAFVYTESRKAYKNWTRSVTMKRWQPGPNANWQQQAPRTPTLSKADLFTLLLAGKLPEGNRINPQLGAMRNTSSTEDDINVEF
jgi:hypothetical protein